jgi:threonine synthase
VPSGNFGNILAGYYAKRMGLPVGKLICASNVNNVLTDFIRTGEYSVKRQFHKTTCPSMDILISSNLERLVFELSGRNAELTAKRMAELKDKKTYSITDEELNELKETFWGDYSDEVEVSETLYDYFEGFGYIADTHTSVALSVYDKYYDETEDDTKTVVLSTASPYKFVNDVLNALGERKGKTELDSLKKLEDVTALPLPETLAELPTLTKRFTKVIDKSEALDEVLDYVRTKR